MSDFEDEYGPTLRLNLADGAVVSDAITPEFAAIAFEGLPKLSRISRREHALAKESKNAFLNRGI